MAIPEPPRPTRIESEDELLQGGGRRADEPLASRLRRLGSRRQRLLGAAAAVVMVISALIILNTHDPKGPASRFTVKVTTAAYSLPRTGGIDSTLTLTNPTPEPLTLTAVTLGRAGGQDVGLGAAVLNLGLAPAEHQTVTIHGDFDCRPNHPALPAYALLTGADRTGRVRTIQAALPDSPAYSAAHTDYRDQVCKLPYPLALADIGYAGLTSSPAEPHDFTTTLKLTLTTADDAVPITLTTLDVSTPGVRTQTTPGLPITLSPGTTSRITLAWTVFDCTAIPPYYGIPTILATAVDARATETRHYALGARFDDELAAALAITCPGSR